MEPTDVTHFHSPEAFRAWLDEHHDVQDVLWVGYWKKSTGRPSLTWEESVDVALCYGWIDGLRKRVDDQAYTIRFTPRRQGSSWSPRNLERYATMEAQGLVAEAGREAFRVRTEEKVRREEPLTLPEEYHARLRAHPEAWADWEERPPGYRRQVVRWIMSAKRESTRERRLAALVEDSAAGRKVKPLR